MNGSALRLARLAFGAVALAALAAGLWRAVETGFDVVDFLSYFTIQTNIMGAAVLLLAAAYRPAERPHWLDWWRGAAAVYLTVTFVVVIVLLQRQFGWVDWIDFVTHKLIPVVVVADFLLDPPRRRLTVREGLWWVAYGLVYLAYTFMRGAMTGWYPYPFLDPASGLTTVALTTVAIVGAGMALSVLYVWLANRSAARRRPMIAVNLDAEEALP